MQARIGAALLLTVVFAGPAAATGSALPIQARLAGRSLSNYPYFQYVETLDKRFPIQIAVDPTRVPDIVGRSCDLYIVAARSEAQWTEQRNLVDIRPGGAQAVVFGGSTIQANTFVAAAAGQLSSNAGAGLGVGYDVVLDCDRDGLLGEGDYIDGRGDEAGFYCVHDTTLPGPLATSEAAYSGGTMLDQIVYYPAAIASMGRLPLVVVSHGWGHNFHWYGHIGHHLASYGYLVMAHSNDVGNGSASGTQTASITTLTNTDYIIGNQSTIAGGVLDGHIDSGKIVWIGHSTGGEGVVRAYTRLRSGEFVPQSFGVEDIALISSIAPVSFLSGTQVGPADVNYHLFYGAADTNVTGEPLQSWTQAFSIYERAYGNRHAIYVHGAGHADFHAGNTSSWADGPDLIGRPTTHMVVKGYYLPLVELYTKGNPAAREFFTRMYEDLHPLGIPGHVVVAIESREAGSAGHHVLDDFQTNAQTTTSSSGGAVTHSVQHATEILMQDFDGSFAWTGSQPSNGMTRYRFTGDNPRAVVFDWPPGPPAFYELEVVPGARDFSEKEFLELRACQGTRHPETDALGAPLTFTVTLRDGNGTSSSIALQNYGRITRPYQRDGAGTGSGWQNEFSTARFRVADFAANGAGIDLTDIVAVRFDFGGANGSAQGRLALDDIQLTPAPPLVPFTLILAQNGPMTGITWQASPGALAYNVYRGTIPALGFGVRGTGAAVYDHLCYQDHVASAQDDSPIPEDRAAFYYIVAAVTAAGEGSLGQASDDLDPLAPGDQLERPNPAPCP